MRDTSQMSARRGTTFTWTTRAFGPITGGSTRTISVASTVPGGAPVVPAAASAVLYNLTVTNTGAAGFLGLFPAGGTWPGNSSINWTGPGQTVANGGACALGLDRQINVRSAGGSTDFIVDITAYYL